MYENKDAEYSVICCLLSEPSSIEKVYGMLSPDMFGIDILGRVYMEMRTAFDDHKELTDTELEKKLEAVGFSDYEIEDALRQSLATNAMPYQITGHASVIVSHYKTGVLNTILDRLVVKDACVDEQIENLIADLEELRGGQSVTVKTVAEIADEYKDDYFIERDKPRAVLNIDDLDSMIGGFEGGDLVILGARPAVGKSALATQWAEMFANMGMKVGFYNLEMTEKQMLERFIAAKSGIEITRLRMALKPLGTEKERFDNAIKSLKEQNRLYISTGQKKVSEIRSDVRKMGYSIIFVDYLQLLTADTRYQGNRAAEVGYISKQLKAIAIDFGIVVIALSQLNRASEGRQDREPSMGELREAGNLEQDASTVILMWNKNQDDHSEKGLKVEKSRQGKTGRCDMRFDGAHMKFVAESQVTPFDRR